MGKPTVDADAIEAADRKYVMRPWTNPAGEPVIVARAKGCVVTDVHGKDYLDLTAGYFVNNVGHCHPRIADAVKRQFDEVLQVSGKHGTIPTVRLAEKQIKLAPRSVNKAFFSTGGSESNEFALKLARQHTKKPDIAYLQNGYHGLTIGALEVTASEKYRESAGKPLGTDPPCWRPCGAPRKSNSLSVEYAVFTIQQYLKYEKLGQYGDPQQQEYRVQVSDYHKKPVGDPKIRAVISRLMAGDNVLLLWNHDCVTKDGSSFPERPLVRLEKDTGGAAVSD